MMLKYQIFRRINYDRNTDIKQLNRNNLKFNDIKTHNIITLLNILKNFKERPMYAYVGKDSNKQKKFSLMYDCFYNNLKDVDGTIFLRPFLDLVKEVIDRYLKSEDFKEYKKPILLAKFHTNREVRKIAVEKHFEDLSNEAGNEDFKTIIEHIKNESSQFPNKFRQRVLKGKLYEGFLDYFYKKRDLLSLTIKDANEYRRDFKNKWSNKSRIYQIKLQKSRICTFI